MKLQRSLALLSALLLAGPAFAHGGEDFKITASDGQPGAQFGYSVSICDRNMSSQLLIAGAPLQDGMGAAYVFLGSNPHGPWPDHFKFREEAKLQPLDLQPGDRFGHAVAISGDIAIVSAVLQDANGVDTGAAYIFVRDSLGLWAQEAKIVQPTTLPNDQFGRAVSIDGETVVIGQAKTAWTYVRNGGLWTEEGHLLPSDNSASFGNSVGISGDRAVVGALGANGKQTNTGAAYVFKRTGTTWAQEAKLISSDGENGDVFGFSVSIFNESTVLAGAMFDNAGGHFSGSAYVFKRSGTSWAQANKIVGEGTSTGDRYGSSCSFSYNTALVGARGDDVGFRDNGSISINRTINGRTSIEDFVENDANNNDALGQSVSAGSGYWLVGGANSNDNLLGVDAGAVYIYNSSPPEVTPYNGNNVNPMCLATTVAPTIGLNWEITVDATPFPGAGFTQVLAVKDALAVPLATAFGEILVSRPSGVLFTSTLPGSGLNTHIIPVPADFYLVGLQLDVQGIIRSPTNGIMGLCNAEDIRIGASNE